MMNGSLACNRADATFYYLFNATLINKMPSMKMAVVAGFAGLEGFDLAAADLVDDARLGGMALKSNLLCGHPEQIKLVGNFA